MSSKTLSGRADRILLPKDLKEEIIPSTIRRMNLQKEERRREEKKLDSLFRWLSRERDFIDMPFLRPDVPEKISYLNRQFSLLLKVGLIK